MQKSKPKGDRALSTGSESGGLSSEKRVVVNALLGKSESMAAANVVKTDPEIDPEIDPSKSPGQRSNREVNSWPA